MLNFFKSEIFLKIVKNDLFKKSSLVAISASLWAFSRFLLVTILARYLSPESYGLWVSITSIAAIMMFGDLGITNALRNKLSLLIADGPDTDNLQREYFYTAFYFFFVASLLLVFGFLAVIDYFPIDKLFRTDNRLLLDQGKQIFVFIQVIFLLSIPFGIASGLFFSYDESHIAAYVNFINSVTSLFAVFFLAFVLKVDIVTLAKVYFLLSLSVNIIALLWFIKRRKWYSSFSVGVFDFIARIKELLSTGFMFLGVQLSNSYITNSPTIFLGALADLQLAASYNIIQKLYVFILTVYQSMFNPIWGRISIYAGNSKWMEIKALHRKIILISLIVFTICVVLFTIFSPVILMLFVGEGYALPRSLTFLIGLSFLAYVLFESTAIFQSAIGLIKFRLFLQLTTAVFIGFAFSFGIKLFGVWSIPVILILVWSCKFFFLFEEGKRYIKRKIAK